MKPQLLFLSLIIFIPHLVAAQSQPMTLQETIEIAKDISIAAKQARTKQETNYWLYRAFQADFRPQLSLEGSVPRFERSFTEVVQPDGTIDFVPISNNNIWLNLSVSQNIPWTGGNISVQKELQRFDNFKDRHTIYNGIPIAIVYSQPISRFNTMKWDREIEPLRYEEGNQQLIKSMEDITLEVTDLYFDLLIAQVNLQIADKNLRNNDTLYKIAIEKWDLGRITQNDLLQIQLSVLTAKKDYASAQQSAQVASLQLKTYIGYREDKILELTVPALEGELTVNAQKALQEAFANRPDVIAFQWRLLEAKRDVDKAKKDNGLNASLNAAFGLSNRGNLLQDVYTKPQDREFVELHVNLPIVTWGRAKARLETAKANLQLAAQSVEQDKLAFEQEIYTEVMLLQMLQQQVELTAEADNIGAKRYQIAQERFLLSDLSVTDLGIATQEKDRARRDAILALRDYWLSYYRIRSLTLFDFEQNKKINY